MNRIEPIVLPVDARSATRVPRRGKAWSFLGLFLFLVILGQAAIVVHARPQDLISGAYGMADILRRSFPPDFSHIGDTFEPALETVDIAVFGTTVAVLLALPLAVLAAIVAGSGADLMVERADLRRIRSNTGSSRADSRGDPQ